MTTIVGSSKAQGSPWARLVSGDPLVVVPRLLALLLVPTAGGLITIGGVIGATIVAATPALLRSPGLWLTLGTVRLGLDFHDWHGVDDHEVLISYACVAFGLALWCREPARVARVSLPALVGLTMAFATLWKIGSGQYLDGDTLRYTLLTDPRFDLATTWFGGMSDADLVANDSAVWALRDPGGSATVTLVEPIRLTVFAYVLTAGAVLIEGALAVLFLRPGADTVRRALLLAVFCVTTYVIVPVSRFGLILSTCAYAGSSGRRDRRILMSIVAFCIVWPVVWTALGGTK